MINKKKVILIFTLLSCFFLLISTASAADFNVNNGTSQKNINDWMKKDAKNGDSLIFNVTKYTLTDTLNISKSINIKSDINSTITFNKNKDMFDLRTNGITFSGLNLIFNGKGDSKTSFGAISAMNASQQTTNKLTVKNTVITVNKDRTSGILLGTVQGSIINSSIYLKGTKCNGISLKSFRGNIIKSNITVNGPNSTGISITTLRGVISDSYIAVNKEFSNAIIIENLEGNIQYSNINVKGKNSFGFYLLKWKGDLINSSLKSSGKDSICVYSLTWTGKVIGSKIYNNGPSKYETGGFRSLNSKGSITKSEIKSKNSFAVLVSDKVKITKTSLSSKKGLSKIFRFRPDLAISRNLSLSKNTYSIKIYNIGQLKSKKCTFQFKTSSVTRKATVKALNPGEFATVKITIPIKFLNPKYKKTMTVDVKKVNKENDKKNNVVSGKF